MRHPALFPIFLIPFCLAAARSFAAEYPEIRALNRDDLLFTQQQSELEDFYRLSRTPGAEIPPVTLFTYRKRPSDDLFSLNARLGLPYDTLASLNGAGSAETFNSRSAILIPSQTGIFVNDPPRTDLEQMILSSRLADDRKPLKLSLLREGKREAVLFFPGENFSSIERLYFLGALFSFPIARGKVTSVFGWRKDPFSDRQEFHDGLDIGAPEGTEVHSAREGTVTETGRTETLGKYVVLSHPGGYQTVYGHLSSINVTIAQGVTTGSMIGTVGSSGRATGPHLHFEVRRKGVAMDPLGLVRIRKG